mgnify:CR=1 FL=1
MSTPEREYKTCLQLGLPDTYSPAKMGLIIQGIANALIELNDKVEDNTDNRPTVNNGVLTLADSVGDVIGTFSANQAADVTFSLPAGFSGEWIDLIGKPDVNDAALVIKDSTGTVLATFTANSADDVEVLLPETFSGNYEDLDNLPTIGDATLLINDADGNEVARFTANAETDVSFNLPEGFSGEWGDLTGKPDVFPPDNNLVDIGLDDLNDVSAAGNEGDYLVKLADGSHGFTALPTPPSLNPLGYIDVSEPAPANPQVGDFYQQHRDDLGDAVASANFNGIVGETAVEGQAVLYGADNQWHLGTSGTPAQVQADYAQTDVNEVDYIKNKPVIGSGIIELVDGNSNQLLGDIDVNQNYNEVIRIPTFSADYNDLNNLPTIGSGTLTIKNPDGTTAATFNANAVGNTDVTLPEGFTGSWNDLTDKPTIGDGQIQVNAGAGLTATGDNGTANQEGNTIRSLSLNSGNGLQINLGDNSVEIDLNYLENNLDLFPEAPADGNIYARKGDTGTWVRALPYDISTLDDLS